MTRKRYDPTDAEQVAERQEIETLRQAQFKADWKWLLGDPRGKRIMSYLLAQTQWLGQSYVPGDALGTAYNEGRRSTAAIIYTTITQTGHDALGDILKELVGADG